jgi:hypothetical protein
VLRDCADKSPAWRARWLVAHIDELDDDIDEVADLSLERAYSDRSKGVTVLFDPEGDPTDRADAAKAWMAEHLDADQLTVVPEPAPREVVDMAAFAARRGR